MNTSRLFSIGEEYKHLVLLIRTLGYFRKARKRDLIDKHFAERIMLGVTQVNGCPICSYTHTKMALEMGMDEEQIKELLGGEQGNVPQEQLKAVMFGQHYAEEKGRVSEKAWNEIVHVYEEDTAKGILGTIRLMMMGNIWGVVIGLFKDRIQHGKVDERSSIGYELLLIFAMIPFLPVASIHALILSIARRPLIKFGEFEDNTDSMSSHSPENPEDK